MRFSRGTTKSPPTTAVWRSLLIVATVVLTLPACSRRQAATLPVGTPNTGRSAQATRAELEASAAQAAREGRQAEAVMLQERLREGDFSVGDRIFLEVRGGEKVFVDTVTVRDGRVIGVPDLPDISVAGVLRSELQAHLQKEIARYIREPEVRATSYVRVTMSGAVGRQGFYAFPADILLSDAIMQSGGPATNWDINKVEVRRTDRVIVGNDAARRAITDGRTLDQLSIRPGDQVILGERRAIQWRQALSFVTALVSLTWLIVRITD
jgi:protein involved in polysaccharide export with SLBB domain